MVKKHKLLFTHLAIILGVSLLPFFWLGSRQAVLGHDAGFPLSPWVHFLDRLFVWSHRFGLGNDQTTEIGGFFIHGFEGLVSWLGFSLTQVQQITFFAYFLGFAISMYVLAKELFPKRKRYLPLIAALLYTINHFILQAWFIVERTKFTLYIALPLALALLVRVSKGKVKPLQAAIWGSFLMFFLNGGGFFPLFGAMLIAIPFMFVALVLAAEDKLQVFKKLTNFILLWAFGTTLLSSFWILPYIRFVITSFAQELQTAGGESGVLAWVQTISQNASFHNLLRLQGIPEWYANPLHPYAKTYLENFWFILFSHLIPILALSSIILAKRTEKKTVGLVMGLALIGILFMAGSHPPLGFIYIWLINNVPGFVIFRTPYYKFAPVLWLAFSLLIAYSVDLIANYWRKKFNKAGVVIVAGFLVIWGGYHFPFFRGNFFEYEVGRKTTKVQVPNYVFEYAQWANSTEFPYQRLLLLPGQNPQTRFEAYTWGYWSLAQLQGLLNNRSYIGNSLYKATTEEVFIKNLFELVERNDPSWVDHARYLFVDAVLLRKDFDYQLEGSPTTNPFELEKILDNHPDFTKIKEFGEWVVYELESNPTSFAFKNYFYEVHTQNKEKFFEPTTIPGVALDFDTVFLETSSGELAERRKGIINIPECVHCLLGDRKIFPVSRNQIVTAGSILFERQKKSDQRTRNNIKNPQENLKFSTGISLKRLFQLESQFGRKAAIEERIDGWRAYVEALEDQHLSLTKYLESINQYSFSNNTFLARVFENTQQMTEELQIGLQEISLDEEVELFLKTNHLLDQIKQDIKEVLWYSSDNITKKYLVEIEEAGSYEVFLKKQTSNSFFESDSNGLNITYSNNNTPYSLDPDFSDQTWAKLGQVELAVGTNKFALTEPENRLYYSSQENPLVLNFDTAQQCVNVTLGYFLRDTYLFNFEAFSERDVNDLYVFIDTKEASRAPLPYWGRRLILDGQKTTYLDFKENIQKADDYLFRFCRLTTSALAAQEIKLTNVYSERVTQPLLAFVQKNPVIKTQSTLEVESLQNNQTNYDLSITGTGKSLLMFDQRFDQGWNFSDNSIFSKHQRVHGYANGWLVQKNNDENFKTSLTYIGQKLATIGWVVSLTSAVIFLVILGKKRVKKNK